MASATAGAIFVFVPLPSPLPSIAHMLKNVSFFLHNVKRPDRGNRRRNAVATGENTMRRHSLGDRFSCKRYRNFCKRYCEGPTAASATGRRGRFSASERRIFRGFNERGEAGAEMDSLLSKPTAPCLRYFRPRGAWWIWRAFSRLTNVKRCIAHCISGGTRRPQAAPHV